MLLQFSEIIALSIRINGDKFHVNALSEYIDLR